ncbi:MAG: 8-oxo-dGTP diphosphatase [Patescibacteria group bacterium]
MPNKLLTLVLPLSDSRLLLGMKKRGFGAGRWNGFGGKVEAGESIEAGAKREIQEEAGIIVHTLHAVGVLLFSFAGQEQTLEVHVFTATTWQGEPQETEEMRPQWFDFDAIPYQEMWLDDKHWLPLVLDGKHIRGIFHFQDQQHLLSYQVEVVPTL